MCVCVQIISDNIDTINSLILSNYADFFTANQMRLFAILLFWELIEPSIFTLYVLIQTSANYSRSKNTRDKNCLSNTPWKIHVCNKLNITLRQRLFNCSCNGMRTVAQITCKKSLKNKLHTKLNLERAN